MVVAADVAELERLLEARHARSIAIVQPAPSTEIETAATATAGMLRALASERTELERVAQSIRDEARPLIEADQFLPDQAREAMQRIIASSRLWAPRYALLVIPEVHPFAVAFGAWVRPYNDAVRSVTRALLDIAAALERRVAEELAEDAEANAWAARQPPRDKTEPTVSWDEVKKRLAAKRAAGT